MHDLIVKINRIIGLCGGNNWVYFKEVQNRITGGFLSILASSLIGTRSQSFYRGLFMSNRKTCLPREYPLLI